MVSRDGFFFIRIIDIMHVYAILFLPKTTAEDELEKLMEDRRKYDLLDCDVDVLA